MKKLVTLNRTFLCQALQKVSVNREIGFSNELDIIADSANFTFTEKFRLVCIYNNRWRCNKVLCFSFAVGGEGSVYEGRSWDAVGAHAVGYNSQSIGIVLIGNFVCKYQLDARNFIRISFTLFLGAAFQTSCLESRYRSSLSMV